MSRTLRSHWSYHQICLCSQQNVANGAMDSDGKSKGIYRYINQLMYHRVYIDMSDISGEIYRYILCIERNISNDNSNK